MTLQEGLSSRIRAIKREIRDEYLQPYSRPWIVGFSGGKDSALVAQLVIQCILSVAPDERKRRVCVVCNDTLVESPVFQSLVDRTLKTMAEGVAALQIPVEILKTKPEPADSFWVSLLGRGYPAPNPSFRWCVDRLKIRPTAKFIREKVCEAGETVLLLGVRKAESIARSQRIERFSEDSDYSRLVPHHDIRGCMIFRPIMDLSTEDVWNILENNPPPWGGTHADLKTLYRDANGADWPFVATENAVPAATSKVLARFGCWTCTVIQKDKSLESLHAGGHEYLGPLLMFRDRLKDVSANPTYRSKTRRNGQHGLGPLTFEARRMLLRELLATQEATCLELISTHEIRLIEEQWAADHFAASKRVVDELVRSFSGCGHGWTCAECTCQH